MIITCPECKTRYMIKSDKLGLNSKKVRCAKCSCQWEVSPAPVETTTIEKPPLPPMARLNSENLDKEQKALNQKLKKRKLGIFISIFTVLFVFLISIFVFKDPISKKFPGTVSIYELLGAQLPEQKQTFAGLIIQDVERQLDEGSQIKILSFSGKVKNQSQIEVPVPNVKVQLFDEDGVLLDEWTAQAEHKTLKAGESTTWVCRFYNAPLAKISQFKTFLVDK